MKNFFRLFVFAPLFFFIPVSAAFARDIILTVEDSDFATPLEGALIYFSDGRTAECDENGRITLSFPDGEEFSVRVTYPGYDTLRWVAPGTGRAWTVRLKATPGGLFENSELLFQAERPPAGGSRTGRGVALPEKQLVVSSEIGIIEDVMSSIKLLPGVGYAGAFNAMPSIRGGDPGDLMAILDGFYIEQPYHWGGGYSIFDPKMVETATLSHGVYSARYGHTVSGVLNIESKRASDRFAEFELGISTSAFNFALNLPFGQKESDDTSRGGATIYGKFTYWDGYVWSMQALAKYADMLKPINAVINAPYIRSVGMSARYKWSNMLETNINSFYGTDGVKLRYENHDPAAEFVGSPDSNLEYSWDNTVSFVSFGAKYNPDDVTALNVSGGFGYSGYEYNALIRRPFLSGSSVMTSTQIDGMKNPSLSLQGRIEVDKDIGGGWLFSGGFEEIARRWNVTYRPDMTLVFDWQLSPGVYQQLNLRSPNTTNYGLLTSLWGIFEWKPPKKKISLELGTRLDQIYFIGDDFNNGTSPAVNPSVTVDYALLDNKGSVKNLSLTAGTGLFSTLHSALKTASTETGLEGLTQTRSWTSVVGTKIDFFGGWTLNIEAYYKYIFKRGYSDLEYATDHVRIKYFFDGYGHAGGLDVMLQKFEGNFFHGWLSYSFNITRYNNPSGARAFNGGLFQEGSDHWYYPEFHRFHNINLVMNFIVTGVFNIYTRVGFASGLPQTRHVVHPYELEIGSSKVTKWRDDSQYSDINRNSFTIPLDLKFSFKFFKSNGKTQGEFYFAVENALILILPKFDHRQVNPYNGKLEEGSDNPLYELPIPMGSFGFKWSY